MTDIEYHRSRYDAPKAKGLFGVPPGVLLISIIVVAILFAILAFYFINAKFKLREVNYSDDSVDVEIIERHHRFKEDAPSGTAIRFGEIVGAAMGLTEHVHGREGRPGQRPRNEIGYHAVRVGDNPGEHTIVFGLLGETLEIRVAASNRDCYAQGALLAAKWLAGKPAGLYGMDAVLGL